MNSLKNLVSAGVFFVSFMLTTTTYAGSTVIDPTPPPDSGLLISWLNNSGESKEIALTLADVMSLPKRTLQLELPKSLEIPGTHQWEGVALKEIIAKTTADGKTIKAIALNGYSVDIPAKDITNFDPIVAYRRDGQFISIREKGPYILIYPFNKFPQLNQQRYINRTIWQINEFNIQ